MRVTLRPDATADCPDCHVPMFPVALSADDLVTLECANRHRAASGAPLDAGRRRLVRNWIATKGAQLHAQHERWDREDDD